MLNANGLCFVSNSNTPEQVTLHPGKVQDADTFHATLQFDADAPLPKTGAVTMYADYRGKFYQQNCKIVATKSAGGNVIVNIERFGDPEPVQPSVEVRINVSAQNITLAIGKQLNCQLVDIGDEGFTVTTPQPLEVGSKVEVGFSVDGIYGNGTAKVQNQLSLAGGKTGFSLTVESRKSPLIKSLEALGNIIQRRQLRKMAA